MQTINSKDIKVYSNLGYIILIINITFIPINIEIKTIPFNIPIRGLNSKIYYSNKFTIITFFLYSLISKKPSITYITREIYIVNNLKAKILIRVDILTLEAIVLDFIK